MTKTSRHSLAKDLASPRGCRTLAELSLRLESARTQLGLSYREIRKRIVRDRHERGIVERPSLNTVYRCFQGSRTRLDVELLADIVRALLGDEPSRVLEWRQAYMAIQRRTTDATIVTVSSKLPKNPTVFVGRDAEVASIMRLINDTGTGPVLITAIGGMAGVGKTQLAIRAAHELVRQHRFDHAFFVDLRGYDAAHEPADPGAVLEGFLRLLGIPGAEIHHLDLAARAARLRSSLSKRTALMLLDNAASTEQVLPLIPAGPNCLTLVTSRRALTGIDSVRPITLDVFSDQEAVDFLATVIGSDRIQDQLGAVSRIAELCGHLPIYLALVAAHIRAKATWTLADHVRRLESFPPDEAIRPALMVSYEALDDSVKDTFRLLALHPGTDFTAYDAAALTNLDFGQANRFLEDLCSEHLLQQRSIDRYNFHDLVAAYARRMVNSENSHTEQVRATDRLHANYLYTASQAMDRIAPHDVASRPPVKRPATPMIEFSNSEAATAWLNDERANLVAAGVTAALEDPTFTAHLSATIWRYLDIGAFYEEAETLHRRAIGVTSPALRAQALMGLGITCGRRGRYPEAMRYFQQAIRLARKNDDALVEARGLVNLGLVLKQSGYYRKSLNCHHRARSLFAQAGDELGQARATINIGIVYEELGRLVEALHEYELATVIFRSSGDKRGLGATLGSIGNVMVRLGRLVEALSQYEQALVTLDQGGDRHSYAITLADLGSLLGKLGRFEEATDHQQRALTIFAEIGHEGGRVRAWRHLGDLCRMQKRHKESVGHYLQAINVASKIGLRLDEAEAHEGVAEALSALGDDAEARVHWQHALKLYTALGLREAERVRKRL